MQLTYYLSIVLSYRCSDDITANTLSPVVFCRPVTNDESDIFRLMYASNFTINWFHSSVNM